MRAVQAVRDLPILAKIYGVILLPLVLMLLVSLPWTAKSLSRMEDATNSARLRDEIKVIEQRFAQLDSDLHRDAQRLASDPKLLLALESGDEALMNSTLIAERARLAVSHLEMVDANGQSIGVEHHGYAMSNQHMFDQLHDLGRLEIRATRLLPTRTGALLVVVEPIKSSADLLGALSIGRLLDGPGLSLLNLERANPVLVLFDEQGRVNATSDANLQQELDSSGRMGTDLGLEIRQGLMDIADGLADMRNAPQQLDSAFGTINIGAKSYSIAYAPLTHEDEVLAIVGVALNSDATTALRKELMTGVIGVAGLLSLVALVGGFFLARIISQPIRKLKTAAEELAAFNLDTRIEVKSRDEVGSLAASFNFMANALGELYLGLETQVSEVTKANEQLADEIVERQRTEEELRALTANLARSNAELEEFASIASHDLQEPLRKVRAFGDRLREGARDGLEAKHQDYLDRMLNAAGRMEALINDLLTYSRVTTKAVPFVPVDLREVTEQVVSDLEVAVEQAGGCVEVGELPTIDAEPTQMRQLIQNLISNSLKFSKPGEPPVIKIRGRVLNNVADNGANKSAEKYDGCEMLELTVEDNGIGFDEKYLDRIFRVFQRLHSRREFAGTGIGLAVCQKILDRHHGTITARSAPGQGAKFIMTLPIHQETDGDDL